MRNLLIILFLLNLVSCDNLASNSEKVAFNCKRTEKLLDMYRCENEEVVCYVYINDAMQCNFKK